MFQECKTNFGHAMALQCDETNCKEEIAVEDISREHCNQLLFDSGWRIHRRKQLCPTHARKVLKRMRDAKPLP